MALIPPAHRRHPCWGCGGPICGACAAPFGVTGDEPNVSYCGECMDNSSEPELSTSWALAGSIGEAREDLAALELDYQEVFLNNMIITFC